MTTETSPSRSHETRMQRQMLRERSRAVPVAIAAPLTAIWAAAIGIAPILTVSLLMWAADSRTTHPAQSALRFSGEVWLMAHGAPVQMNAETLLFLPLAWTIFITWQLWRAGVSTARATGARDVRHSLLTSVAIAGSYAALGGATASVARSDAVFTSVWIAAAATGVYAAVVAGIAVGVEAGVVHAWWSAAPQFLRCGVLRGVRTLLWMVVVASALVLLSLLLNSEEVIRIGASSSPGVVGGIGVFLLSAMFLPNIIVWGVSYLCGAGFGVGEGTSITLFSVELGLLPQFPLLAALPHTGGGVWIALLVIPVAVGSVHGVFLARHMMHAHLWRRYAACGVAVLCVTVGASVLGILSSGSLGEGYLATLGPRSWKMGMGAAGTLGAGLLFGVIVLHPVMRLFGRDR